MKPLAVDLACGLGGWTEGLLAEGWDVLGFDIERHVYGSQKYPAQLVLQDILTLDGRQFRGKVGLIVASPPCQFFNYTAMPWSRAKQIAVEVRSDPVRLANELALFNACVRIGKEAGCPTVIENVRGAVPWVGRSRTHYGSFHLWGDVPALMPIAKARKNKGGSWFAIGSPGQKVTGQNPVHELSGHKHMDLDGIERNHPNAFGWKIPITSSNSIARKAASAQIAKIPLRLSRHIAAHYRPNP